MPITQRIQNCLWFDDQAEEAATYYTGIFKNSRIGTITRYGKEQLDAEQRVVAEMGVEATGKQPGSVMTVEFVLDGQKFTALNGGPLFKFNEAVSLEIHCESQAEIDYYWDKLTAGGDPNAQQCGWLKDRYGVSWQVVPDDWADMMKDPDSPGSQRAFAAMLQMKKLDIAALEKAYSGS